MTNLLSLAPLKFLWPTSPANSQLHVSYMKRLFFPLVIFRLQSIDLKYYLTVENEDIPNIGYPISVAHLILCENPFKNIMCQYIFTPKL